MNIVFTRTFPVGFSKSLQTESEIEVKSPQFNISETNKFSTVKNDAFFILTNPREVRDETSKSNASYALENIFFSIKKTLNSTEDEKNPAINLSLEEIEFLPINSMMMASLLIIGQTLGDIAVNKGEMINILSKKQESIRQEQVKNILENIEIAIERQKNIKKSAIISVIFDWIIAAVEVGTGVVKIAGGAMTGNALQGVGGAMDLMAGVTGIGKAISNTLAIVDEDNAETYSGIAEKFGKAQMAFEITGAAVDITSAVRNAVVAKAIPKSVNKVMKEGVEEILNVAIKEGSESAVKGIVNSVSKEVGRIFNTLLTNVAQSASKSTLNKLFGNIFQETIEQLVEKSVKKVAKSVMKKGIDLSEKELSKRIVAQVKKEVIETIIKSSLSTVNLVKVSMTAMHGIQQAATGVLDMKSATLQKDVDQLVLYDFWLKNLFQFFEQEKKESIQKIRNVQESKANTVQDGTLLLTKTAANQAQMASSMV